jgi:hypothetical protein
MLTRNSTGLETKVSSLTVKMAILIFAIFGFLAHCSNFFFSRKCGLKKVLTTAETVTVTGFECFTKLYQNPKKITPDIHPVTLS